MAYTPTNWVDGTTPVNEANLDKMELGIDQAHDLADAAQATADAAGGVATAAQATASAAIPKGILDAKGDLIGASAADTPARLAVGTDGQAIVADAASPIGMKWAGAAVPPGGAVGTILKKTSATDYATAWSDDPLGAGQRLGATAKVITDWNAATENGWYQAAPGSNCPTPLVGSTSLLGRVEMANSSRMTQTVWDTGHGGANTALAPKYERRFAFGTWGPWNLAAAGASLTYEGDYAGATTYDDGDVVVKDGIAYICVGGPTTDAPDIAPWGNAALNLAGDELAYAESSADVVVPVVAQASAATVITAPAITLDGATDIIVEYYTPQLTTAIQGAVAICNLWDGSTDIGNLGQTQHPGSTAVGFSLPFYLRRRLRPSAGTHTYSIRGWAQVGAWSAVGQPGGANRQPMWIRVSRVVPSPPSFGAGALTPVTYGTTLPASPTDGQEAILVDSLTAPTYSWRFRYNAGHASDAYKWEFIGGSRPDVVIAASGESTNSGTFTTLTTSGPNFTCPRAGLYEVTVGMNAINGTGIMSFAIGATAAVEANAAHSSGDRASVVTVPAAATVLSARYRASDTGAARPFYQRHMMVQPVRVA